MVGPPSAPPPTFACAAPSLPVGDHPPVSAAIARGEAFLQGRGAHIDPMMTLILEFVGRRYGIPWMQAAADPLRTPAPVTPCTTAGGCAEPPSLYAFRRLLDPSADIQSYQLPSTNTLDAFTVLALHCAAHDLPADYPQRVEQRLDPNGPDYDPPHAALALQWALEQGCLDQTAGPIRALRTHAIEQLLAVAGGVPRDQPIVALAMLDYLGERQCISAGWIDALTQAQRDDGGWGDGAGQPSNDHTTTLALWVLLAQVRPPGAVAWIPQR